MLYPSIDELMQKLDSKYTLVAVAAKRARKLREKSSTYLENPQAHKNVGIALEEIIADQIEFENPYLSTRKQTSRKQTSIGSE